MTSGLGQVALAVVSLGANESQVGAMGDSIWFPVGLAAQGIVTICFVSQFIAFLRGGRIVVPPFAVVLGLAATILVGVYALEAGQWVLLLAEATNFAAGLQLLAWRRRAAGPPSTRRRPGLPVVAPHTADPKSGVVAVPRSGSQSPTK
jgi:lipid-A-disaccharide synthase-like uncharacterized protein